MRPERKEWTTRGADPTVVVQWIIELPHGCSIKLTEFQNVYEGIYGVDFIELDMEPGVAEYLHQALEMKWGEDHDNKGE